MDPTWRPLTLLRLEINEVIERRKKSGNGRLYKRWKALKHLHAVILDWRVLGETVWSMASSDASRRGFTGILFLNNEVLEILD